MFPIGTPIYYTGDMANADGYFVVTAYRNGYQYDLRESNGDRELHGIMHIADKYHGNCADRFVTVAAHVQGYLGAALFPAVAGFFWASGNLNGVLSRD